MIEVFLDVIYKIMFGIMTNEEKDLPEGVIEGALVGEELKGVDISDELKDDLAVMAKEVHRNLVNALAEGVYGNKWETESLRLIVAKDLHICLGNVLAILHSISDTKENDREQKEAKLADMMAAMREITGVYKSVAETGKKTLADNICFDEQFVAGSDSKLSEVGRETMYAITKVLFGEEWENSGVREDIEDDFESTLANLVEILEFLREQEDGVKTEKLLTFVLEILREVTDFNRKYIFECDESNRGRINYVGEMSDVVDEGKNMVFKD